MAFARNARARREARIKMLLANEIYFKGIAVKVIAALRSIIKPREVEEIPDHYMIQCEIN
jgi:hypothetical protein